MLLTDFYVRVRHACLASGLIPPQFDEAETLAAQSLQSLAIEVAMDARHAYLEKDYSVTLTSGVASLVSHTDMLHEFIRRIVYQPGEDEQMIVSLLPDGATRNDLSHERNTFYLYAIRQAQTLYLQTGDVEDPDDGTLTVTASFTPTLSALPIVLDDDLISTAVGMVTAKAA